MTGALKPLDKVLEALAVRCPVPLDAINSVAVNGHAVVRGLATAQVVDFFAPLVNRFVRQKAEITDPLDSRSTYGKAFLQVHNLWEADELIRNLVFASRFAQVAADLLGVSSVRLYHDQALCKEPGGGHTPWHQDQSYWPLDTAQTITMWMPLVDVPSDVGSMTFANGTQDLGNLGPWLIGDESETSFQALVEERGFKTHTYGAMRAGDATFHKGWTLHRAGANDTALSRLVMTVIWYSSDATISKEIGPAQKFDHARWLGGMAEGSAATGPLNPQLWPKTIEGGQS